FISIIPSPTTDTYTLSLHDALPICLRSTFHTNPLGAVMSENRQRISCPGIRRIHTYWVVHILCKLWFLLSHHITGAHHKHTQSRSEEHTSELQSRENLVCRLLLEKK